MIKAEVIKDSVGPSGQRITTFVLTFPRIILAELNTHRMLSRNAASSRAIPTSKILEQVKNDPFVPLAFTKNQKGMQATELVQDQEGAVSAWLKARDSAVSHAEEMLKIGIHKQHLNRILEPFCWTSVVCTATDWANFFALRHHHMAQPEFQELARLMWEAREASNPRKLGEGRWHLPFITDEEYLEAMDKPYTEPEELDALKTVGVSAAYRELIKRSVARCARVSYLREGVQTTLEEDSSLYSRLLGGHPIHASCAEHIAMAIFNPSHKSGNFTGWIQYRKMLKNENITEFTGPLK